MKKVILTVSALALMLTVATVNAQTEPKKKEEPLPDNIIVGTGYHNSNNHL